MLKILHFSDAHIDIANHGKRDPETGLPIRVLDFLNALDFIVNSAIQEKVDLVIFAGDAYRDRTPAPTFQREWGKRMMRLSEAGIPTIMLVGNHDISPAYGRAHALQEYDTLSIPHLHVIGKPSFLRPEDIEDLPVQIIALPWVTRSSLIASLEISAADPTNVYAEIEQRLEMFVENCLEEADSQLPIILTAHASVQGAVYGGERSVMLGKDQVLSTGLVRKPGIDYVALGHIHKPQDLNENAHPPVIYPGSIERVDFGEVADQKYFVLAEVSKGKTNVAWVPINGRPFVDDLIDLRDIDVKDYEVGSLPSPDRIRSFISDHLPSEEEIKDAIARVTLIYPREWETLIDEKWLRDYYEYALETMIVRKPQTAMRIRLADNEGISALNEEDLLKYYLESRNIDPKEITILNSIAKDIFHLAVGDEETDSEL